MKLLGEEIDVEIVAFDFCPASHLLATWSSDPRRLRHRRDFARELHKAALASLSSQTEYNRTWDAVTQEVDVREEEEE